MANWGRRAAAGIMFGLALLATAGAANVELGESGWQWTKGTDYFMVCSWHVTVQNNTRLHIPVDAEFSLLDSNGDIVITDCVTEFDLQPGRNVIYANRYVSRKKAIRVAATNNYVVTVSQSP